MNARLAGLAISLVSLAACNPSGGVTNPPRSKAGLWTQTIVLNGQTHGPSPFCDPGHVVVARGGGPDCPQWQATRASDGAIEVDAVCTRSGQTMHIHRRIAGDFAKAYSEDMTGVGATPDAPQRMTIHFDYRYLGACPPGMKPFNGKAPG